ncbi:transcription antitermination factor NusB [Alkalicoccobacillus gibsonii]|jgi:transcription antitermination protein NusB|uniref:Transcription antitermination protein NusB n=1 Tax=Alkalicoccobacillus gibsonii TaxID=79881 RepID=A0ABU9VJS7_9BACI|nr:transcription antitermination factor NusB [Alkalicoccobacillus gibsonii]MBM0067657.1 transcription antitermination factor NusB [Alkalicoccobacillus gibsonii]
MNRRVARLRAAQALYQIDVIKTEPDLAMESVLNDDEEPSDFFHQLVHGTLEHKKELDGWISSNLQGYTIERIGHVDRAIARMALFEMKYIDDIPANVTFNEAIELSKAFGGEEAGRFMNGVLSNSVDMMNRESNE